MAVGGGGDDGVLQLLAPGRDGAVAPAAAAAAPHAAAAVVAVGAVAVVAALAPGRRAGEVGVGLVSGLDGAVGATVTEMMKETRLKLITGLNKIGIRLSDGGMYVPRAVVVLGRLGVPAAALAPHHLVGADAGVLRDGGVLLARILPPAPEAGLGPFPRGPTIGGS